MPKSAPARPITTLVRPNSQEDVMATVAPNACGRSSHAAYPTITFDQQEAVQARSRATLLFSAVETKGGSTSLAMTPDISGYTCWGIAASVSEILSTTRVSVRFRFSFTLRRACSYSVAWPVVLGSDPSPVTPAGRRLVVQRVHREQGSRKNPAASATTGRRQSRLRMAAECQSRCHVTWLPAIDRDMPRELSS